LDLQEIYLKGKKKLLKSGIKSASFEAMCILKFCFGVDRHELIINPTQKLDEQAKLHFFDLILQRANGRPLQYILEEWEFMGKNFKVGEGVLIPRDDTEILVKTAIAHISSIKSPQILDLCAGSGIISIILAINFPDANITCLEISENAIYYLNKNIKLILSDFYSKGSIQVIKGDIFSEKTLHKFELFDLIVCNPPYIPSEDIKYLQKEVQNEPLIALDGGPDGLNFYRVLTKKWKSQIKFGGTLAVEVGKGQASNVAKLFEEADFKNISIKKDLCGIDRVVTGKNE
jgi:release factor glutamine methyltransferase